MCLVSEHRELQRLLTERDLTIQQQQDRIADLLNQLAQMELPPKPDVPLFEMPKHQVDSELRSQNVELLHQLMDTKYRYTSAEGWMEVFDYLYFVFPWPHYTSQFMDCDDFGLLMKALPPALFGLNYIAFALGDIPAGYHGFNIYRDDQGFMVLEPQSLTFFDWGDREYTPEKVLL